MGIFSNGTEEEKNYKKLIKAIRSSNLDDNDCKFLINYVDEVNSDKRNNDFFNFEFLSRVIIELCGHYNDIENTFNEYVRVVRLLLPEGTYTENYNNIMEMYINNFCGENGFIEKKLFDKQFYALFQNRYDYLYFMNIIIQDEELLKHHNCIFKYALEVSPYCLNSQTLKNELLSFINGIHFEFGNLSDYYERMLNESKKRCGIYPIDEKTLANISAEASKAQSLIDKLNAMQKSISTYQERIKSLTSSGKKEIGSLLNQGKNDIKNYASNAILEMNESILKIKAEMVEELEKYLLTLEETLKRSSDEVFNKILVDAQSKIREIKLAAQGLSQTTTSELLRIQSAADASVSQLKNYVENKPELQELLKEVQADDAIREALLKFSSLHSKTEVATVDSLGDTPSIIIPGNDRLIVPANPSVVVPDKGVTSSVIPAFDESIPFNLRMQKILAEKEKRENNGEIFHEKTEEIIRCILEGDWCYLWGPSGCGKSYTIKQISDLIGLDMIDNGKITDKYSIMAYNDPQGRFRATQAFVALVYGKLLSLDEFDNGNPDTQVVLNELYSGLLDVLEKPEKTRYVTFAEDMRVPINPNFRMISAGNTSGEGENQAFSSRGKIDESVQQRMTPKRFWYDNRVEQIIFGESKDWYNIFVNFRKACDAYALHEGLDTPIGIVTTRDAAAIVKYIKHDSKTVDQVLAEKFVQTKSADYLKFIASKFKEYYSVNDTPSSDFEITDSLGDVKEKYIVKKLILQCNKKRN